METSLTERIERIAKTFGVAKTQVHLDFRVYAGQDGGPTWSIYVQIPSQDRRRSASTKHGAGATLDEAEANLIPQPKADSRESVLRNLHAQGLLDAQELENALASLRSR
jgi:hypothetical protein